MISKNVKKSWFQRVLKKSLFLILVSSIGLNSGFIFNVSDNYRRVGAYFNDDHYLNQTRIMTDINNMLNPNYWMQVDLTAAETNNNLAAKPTIYSAKLRFVIPGYDINNLKFFISDKNPLNEGEVMERVLESADPSEEPSINLDGLKQSTYDVYVYKNFLAKENFVCKADFCITNKGMSKYTEVDILDGNGSPLIYNGSAMKLTYYKASSVAGANQTCLFLPLSLIPYDSLTVKVVFFVSETDRSGAPVNVSETLFDYVWEDERESLAYGGTLRYYPEAIWGTDSNLNYEAHFYKNEVKKENFICKAVGIKLS